MIKIHNTFKPSGVFKNKHQIILINTGRYFDNYITSLRLRNYGKNTKIPHFIIEKNGNIHQLLTLNEYSEILNKTPQNKKSIIISLENLGWLTKEPLKDYHVNWIGDIYNEKTFDRKWREYYFWDKYSENQYSSLNFVINKIIKETDIKYEVIGYNTLIKDSDRYEGIISRSNLNERYTDVNPSFDFEKIKKKIENE
jgi:N-acetyl-anhydromuramyl-L-alanine amidase AmpD